MVWRQVLGAPRGFAAAHPPWPHNLSPPPALLTQWQPIGLQLQSSCTRMMTCLPVPNASSRAAYVQQSHLFCEVSKDVLRSPNDGERVLLCVIFKLELIITDTILTSEQDCSEFKKCIIYLRMTNPFDEPAKQGEAVI